MFYVNLTQHDLTEEQLADGAIELNLANRQKVRELLTFTCVEDACNEMLLESKAVQLAKIASDALAAKGADPAHYGAMIGGAPFFMGPLYEILVEEGITPAFSFTERKSVETKAADGTVTKTSVFKHVGWVKYQ